MTAPAPSRTRPAHHASPAERAQAIADARKMLDWLEANPDMPVPAWGIQVWAYADGRQGVDHLAARMGVKPDHNPSAHRAERRFGFGCASYVAYSANLEVS